MLSRGDSERAKERAPKRPTVTIVPATADDPKRRSEIARAIADLLKRADEQVE